ncbi:sulfotransferase domain-containing protein [Ornithinimicrobium murale]|uniref:sulfotransferase domain-containing protein n=1 Tax=Ornithinimicrobium murale TaxID=1050153 RepID=UPI000E0D4AEE|nr:sulfotransferase domain-containing protein [Ornithinimicrobium murale]
MTEATAESSEDAGLLFDAYCAAPERYWPERSQRQAQKLAKHLDRVAQTLQSRRTLVPRTMVELARRRAGARRPTVYLVNIGSSGSHWLEEMLVRGAGMLGAGEVYLPPSMDDPVSGLAPREAEIFIDALHVLHAGGVAPDEAASVINSQHSVRPQAFSADTDARHVLLLRDPIDVCLSRTFRKDEYRQDVAPQAEDVAYLRSNVAKVKSFLTAAQRQDFDLVIRYEDLLVDPVPSLMAVSTLTSTPTQEARLRQVAEQQSAEQLTASGGAAATNLFTGRRRRYPASAERLAHRELGPLRASFGYPPPHD